MSIEYSAEKINPEEEKSVGGRPHLLYWIILGITLFCLIFGLVRLGRIESKKSPIRVTTSNVAQTGAVLNAFAAKPVSDGQKVEIVASKNGKKYYYSSCGGAKLIKPENKITFASTAAARAAGYSPATNCKGLE